MRNDRSSTPACAACALSFLFVLLVAACPQSFAQAAAAAQPGLAPTPPMGWASWNPFFCDYNDQTIRDQADALVSTGLRDLGYRYLLIQECLTTGRQADGSIIVDSNRFPHGMKDLVDYVHSRGLKAGTYTDVGEFTCAGKPYQGSYRHEDQDAATFAAWGMDFVEMTTAIAPTKQLAAPFMNAWPRPCARPVDLCSSTSAPGATRARGHGRKAQPSCGELKRPQRREESWPMGERRQELRVQRPGRRLERPQ